MIKRAGLIAMTAVLLGVVVSITLSQNRQRRSPVPNKPNPVMTKSRIEREAEAENRKFWSALFTVCGDSYFGDVAPGLSEMRGVMFSVSPRTLDGLDRENGYEWRGHGVMRFSRRRIRTSGRWLDWVSSERDWMTGGKLTAVLQKKGGDWSAVYSPFDRNVMAKRPTCEQLSRADAPAAAALAQGPSYGEGVIRGTVTFAGEPPKPRPIDMGADPWCQHARPQPVLEDVLVTNGKLAYVFIYVEGGSLDTLTFEPPPYPVVLEHDRCQLVPHVVGVQTGQALEVRNGDNTVHNTSARPVNNAAWNVSQSLGSPPIQKRFEHPEMFIPVKDNQHPWEKAFIMVLAHPFFSISSREGEYEIIGLPPGEYKVIARHERYGEQAAGVSVGLKESKRVDFTFTERAK